MAPQLSPINQVRRHLLGLKLQTLQRFAKPDPSLDALPLPFVVVTTPYIAYPAPGAAASVLLTYTVPPGQNTVITLLAVFNVGAAFVNGSGNVIWRVLINNAGVKGLENMQSQFGADSLPISVAIPMVENDTIQITVEVPAGQPALPFPANSTGARIHGGSAPASIGTLAGLGQSGGGGSSSSSSSVPGVTPSSGTGSSPSPSVPSAGGFSGGGNNRLPQS